MRTPAARLRLVGDGAGRAKIARQVSALGLDGRVELVGFRPHPAPDFRAADVVIVPSRYDGMALVLLEAMACGAAIVATRVAGASALDGVGILVPTEEPASLALAVDALLADSVRRRELGIAARSRAVERYSLQRSLEGTVGLWQVLGAFPDSEPHETRVSGQTIPVVQKEVS
jgi:glycosyltransferase involved in cell wall biosynthesis